MEVCESGGGRKSSNAQNVRFNSISLKAQSPSSSPISRASKKNLGLSNLRNPIPFITGTTYPRSPISVSSTNQQIELASLHLPLYRTPSPHRMMSRSPSGFDATGAFPSRERNGVCVVIGSSRRIRTTTTEFFQNVIAVTVFASECCEIFWRDC
eukprot:c5228_g2_i2.p1 GENE.c5228_g2_i2~~c5228_g2_i2.p1  ORF type:complete len:154 (+),score=43.15 c5228_g2_i2:65-526(+)